MRIKPTDQSGISYSVSDIHFDSPEPTDRFEIEEQPPVEEKVLPAEVQDEKVPMLMEEEPQLTPNDVTQQQEEEEQIQVVSTPPRIGKSEVGKRIGFKGTLKHMYSTKKDAYVQDGSEMLQVSRIIKQTEDKIQLLQSRINVLQRKDNQTIKQILSHQNHIMTHETSQKSLFEIKKQKSEIRERREEQSCEKMSKVQQMRMKNAQSKEKLKSEAKIKHQKLVEQKIQDTLLYELKRKEKLEELEKEKKEKASKIKEAKKSASERKKRQEFIFLGRIQHCYHQEKEMKLQQREENEQLIRELEELEQKMVQKFQDTQKMQQEIKSRSFIRANDSQGSPSRQDVSNILFRPSALSNNSNNTTQDRIFTAPQSQLGEHRKLTSKSYLSNPRGKQQDYNKDLFQDAKVAMSRGSPTQSISKSNLNGRVETVESVTSKDSRKYQSANKPSTLQLKSQLQNQRIAETNWNKRNKIQPYQPINNRLDANSGKVSQYEKFLTKKSDLKDGQTPQKSLVGSSTQGSLVKNQQYAISNLKQPLDNVKERQYIQSSAAKRQSLSNQNQRSLRQQRSQGDLQKKSKTPATLEDSMNNIPNQFNLDSERSDQVNMSMQIKGVKGFLDTSQVKSQSQSKAVFENKKFR